MNDQENEKYMTAKELVAALKDMGITTSEDYVRGLWKLGAPHVGRFCLMSEFMHWWRNNPQAAPRSKSIRVVSRREMSASVETRGIRVL